MKKLTIFIIIFISLFLCTCENEWMKEILPITITFDTDDGTPVPPPQTLYRGDKVSKPTNNPTKQQTSTANYMFTGWYEFIVYDYNTNGSPTNVNEEKSKRYDFDSVPLHDMTLHAGWAKQD